MTYHALRLKPVLKKAVWAGQRLAPLYGSSDKVAEAWVVSGHPHGETVVEGGPMAGKTLWQAVLEMGKDCVGKGFEGEAFPQLIKLIDAGSPLSVQVHPDDRFAAKYEHSSGKTEAWWVLQADEDASLVYGLRRYACRAALRRAALRGTLEPWLRTIPARQGEVFFIPSGTVHAIGAGLLIAEVQQPSDVTYRMYDYGRLGADGQPRPLHVSQALRVARRRPCRLLPQERFPDGLSVPGLFGMRRWQTAGEETLTVGENSYAAVLCLWGAVGLRAWGENFALRPGECVFVPAGAGVVELSGQGGGMSFGRE